MVSEVYNALQLDHFRQQVIQILSLKPVSNGLSLKLIIKPISFFLLLITIQFSKAAQQQNLPSLGDTTSGIVSLEQERVLGQDFLRSLRAQAPSVDDPLLQSYLDI